MIEQVKQILDNLQNAIDDAGDSKDFVRVALDVRRELSELIDEHGHLAED